MCSCVFINPYTRVGHFLSGILYAFLIQFSFYSTGYLIKIKEPSLVSVLLLDRGKIIEYIPFSGLLMRR